MSLEVIVVLDKGLITQRGSPQMVRCCLEGNSAPRLRVSRAHNL